MVFALSLLLVLRYFISFFSFWAANFSNGFNKIVTIEMDRVVAEEQS